MASMSEIRESIMFAERKNRLLFFLDNFEVIAIF